jgi:hypothetical protein
MRLKFRADHSPHPEASACFRCIVPWSAQKRDQEETGFVPIRLQNYGTGARASAAKIVRCQIVYAGLLGPS